ncbi:MAG: hypothetical protein IKO51_03285 [Clostridia bacterium]|nr:hypothetical protein [Clostridia bacterium]
MKKLVSVFLAVLMLCTMSPVQAAARSASQRTEKLDLTAVTSAASNAAEGWAYDPTGDGGNPILTLTNYGTADAHSAPVLVPANTKVIVNGDCYIDNACIGADCDLLSGCCDGYLKLEGTGTLNLYALEYQGRGISVPTGGVTDMLEFLYINDITVNIYSQQPKSNTAYYIKEGIYANQGLECHNATINIVNGTKAIWLQGSSPIPTINLTEETCPELLIDNTDININITQADGNSYWNYAKGLYVVCGRVVITGGSNVNINAGSDSIYASFSLTIESGDLNIYSMPAGTNMDAYALVRVNNLVVESGAESVSIKTQKWPLTRILYCKTSGISSLGDGLTMQVGTFENGVFSQASDPDNGDLPGLKIVKAAAANTHTVSFYGYDGALIEAVQVEDEQAAAAPDVPKYVTGEHGPMVFYGWDADFSNVTEDMDVHALYTLRGDIDFDGEVTASDALLAMRYAMSIITLEPRQIAAGDMDSNDAVEASDAILIMRYVISTD